jgi:hypothetical protein
MEFVQKFIAIVMQILALFGYGGVRDTETETETQAPIA